MTTAAIRTVGLTKTYGRVTALDSLDLEIVPGEVVGYLGPNGAGKPVTELWHSMWRGAANSSRKVEWTAESRYVPCALSS